MFFDFELIWKNFVVSTDLVLMSSNTKLNINLGILGHVDCGKTSLARALSTKFSTASLDKLPESRKRGITIDLGFSSFYVPVNEKIKQKLNKVNPSAYKNIKLSIFTMIFSFK